MTLQNIINNILKRKTFIDSGAVLVDQGLMSLATFIIGVLLARAVSVEDYGIFVLGWSLVFTIQSIQRGLVVLPFTVNCPKMTTAEQGRHLGSGLIHTILLGLISLSIFGALLIQNAGTKDNDFENLYQALPLVALVLIPFLLREQLRSATLAKLDFLGSAKTNILASVLTIGISISLYLEQKLTLGSAYTLITLTALLASLALLYRQKNQLKISITSLWPDLRYNLKVGKWILVNAAAYTLISQLYPWLLLWFHDQSSVAVYGACLAIAGVLNPLLRGVTTYALPRMSHSHNENSATLVGMLRKTIGILFIPFGLWALVGSLYAEQLMQFFYTDKYAGYGIVLSLLLIKTLIESVSAPLTSILQATHRPHITTGSLVAGAIINLTFGIYLVKEYAVIGASVASILSFSCIALWKIHFIRPKQID